jgi:hypothetical protein
MMETIMMRIISTMIITLALVAAGSRLWLEQAQASQGPGVTPGTASTTMQLAMAVIIYGGSALLIAVGLIGAVRKKKSGQLN